MTCTCRDCHWWVSAGCECHRYPKPYKSGRDHWCGESVLREKTHACWDCDHSYYDCHGCLWCDMHDGDRDVPIMDKENICAFWRREETGE